MSEEGNAKPVWERSPVRVATVLVVLVSVGVLWEINTEEVVQYNYLFEPGLTIRTTGWPTDYVRVLSTWPRDEVTYWLPTGILINCLVALGYLSALGYSLEWWLRHRPLGEMGWPRLRMSATSVVSRLQVRLSTLLMAMLLAGALLGVQSQPHWEITAESRGDFVKAFGWPLPAAYEIDHVGLKPNSMLFRNWNILMNGWFGLGLLFIGASVWEMGCARREFLAKAKGDAAASGGTPEA